MKKIRDLSIITFFLLLAFSCDKDDEIQLPAGPENVQVNPGYGEALFTWDFPEGQGVEYVRVDYTNSEGKSLHQKFSQYTDIAVISGLEEREYTFQISVGDKSGNLSDAKSVNITPYQPPYLFVKETIGLIADFGSVVVSWENETEKEVGINVVYTDANGVSQTHVVNTSEAQGSMSISNVSATEQTFEVYVSNAQGLRSENKTFTAKPLKEVSFAKNNWEVIDISSEEPAEGGDNGVKGSLIDDTIDSFWHSAWAGSQPDFPHHFTIDMKEVRTVSRLGLVNRQNNTQGMTKIKIEGSVDNVTWENLGEFPFEQINAEQKFRLTSNPQIRYFKVTGLEGPNFYTFLAEVYAYGE
ncbi:DUF5126 domain-containing protein [Rapidithrix thailandica]|uniref:DUF5126 domain-containing protein n=1 Tax=Rapidithrix thailandica TaxID=413964 RepID=A0AAW9S5P2_9BACT